MSFSHHRKNLWEIHRSSKGRIYYYNVLTDRSQWEKPPNHQLFPGTQTKKKVFLKRSRSKNHFSRRKSLDEISLLTPISPPENEKIPLDLVDPILTPSDSLTRQEEPSMKLEHSSSTLSTNSDSKIQYYRAELIEHLLNWPSTQIERETIRLSNEQIRNISQQLLSLRTDLHCIRLRDFHLRHQVHLFSN